MFPQSGASTECTQSVGMGEGTESVGSVVCVQQLGKAEETQCSDGGACTVSRVGCTHFQQGRRVHKFAEVHRVPTVHGSMECTESVGMFEDKQPVVMAVCTPLDGTAVHAVDRVGCACTVGGVGSA